VAGVKKTECEVKKEVRNVLLSKSPEKIYTIDEIKRVSYCEWVAEEIITHYDKLKINQLKPRDTYDANHVGCIKNDTGKRTEKVIAKQLYNAKTDYEDTIGRIFDYEVPVWAVDKNGAGEVDLVSETKDCIYLIEFKRPKSSESLLRCVMEIITYYKQLPKDKFLDSFIESRKISKKLPVKAAILIFEDSAAYRQKKKIKSYPRTSELIKKLMEDFDVEVDLFYIKDYKEDVIRPCTSKTHRSEKCQECNKDVKVMDLTEIKKELFTIIMNR